MQGAGRDKNLKSGITKIPKMIYKFQEISIIKVMLTMIKQNKGSFIYYLKISKKLTFLAH